MKVLEFIFLSVIIKYHQPLDLIVRMIITDPVNGEFIIFLVFPVFSKSYLFFIDLDIIHSPIFHINGLSISFFENRQKFSILMTLLYLNQHSLALTISV